MDEHEALALGLRIARSVTAETPFAEAADYASAAAMAILAVDLTGVVDVEPYLWAVGRRAIIDEYRRTHGRRGNRHAETVPLIEKDGAAMIYEQRVGEEERIAALPKALSARQREVLRHLATGETVAGVAQLMGLAPETVRSHLKNARATLSARNVTHAVALAIGRGEIPLPAVREAVHPGRAGELRV